VNRSYANLDVSGSKVPPPDHVKDPSRSSAHDVLTILQLLDVLSDTSATDTGMALDVHVISQSKDDILDLNSEFSCGGKDKCLSFPDRGVDGL
jgi:hypothetical protein